VDRQLYIDAIRGRAVPMHMWRPLENLQLGKVRGGGFVSESWEWNDTALQQMPDYGLSALYFDLRANG